MGTYTTNLNLEKPSDADTADIAVINGNMDVLDGVIGDVDTATDGDLQTQVDTLRDSVSQLTLSTTFVSKSATYTCAAGANASINITFSPPSGYTMLNFSITSIGGGAVVVRSFQVVSNTEVIFYVRNLGTSAVTNVTFSAVAVYAKITS